MFSWFSSEKNVTEVGKFCCELCTGIVMCKGIFFSMRQVKTSFFSSNKCLGTSTLECHLTSLWYSSWTWSAPMSSQSLAKHLEFRALFLMKLRVLTLTVITSWNSGDIFLAAWLSRWRKQCVHLASGAQSSLSDDTVMPASHWCLCAGLSIKERWSEEQRWGAGCSSECLLDVTVGQVQCALPPGCKDPHTGGSEETQFSCWLD